MEDRDEDDQATVLRPEGQQATPPGRSPVESPTRRVDAPLPGTTRAMPSGYGLAHFAPPARPSAPRPAAGRPAVPRIIDDPTSESEMTLIERIDAELESKTAEFDLPEGVDPSILDEDSGVSSEATIRMPVPDDLPSDLLDAESDAGTDVSPRRPQGAPSVRGLRVPMPAPSFSSMPTPPLGSSSAGVRFAPPPDPPEAPSARAPVAEPPASTAAVAPISRPAAPVPGWVRSYIVLCFVVTLMGALALTYLKLQRYW